MVIDNIYAMPTTKMTLSDRFTILQNVRPVSLVPRQRYTSRMHSDLEMNQKQRRIVERLALKTMTQAATVLQKRTVKQRLGTPNRPVKVLNKYKLSKPLKRKNIGQRSLIDSKPQANRNNKKPRRNRPIRRRNTKNRVKKNDNSQLNNQQNVTFTRGRGSRRRGLLRGQSGGQTMNENFNMNNAEMRGRGNNRGRGINRSWFGRKALPTKEELDKQLDSYMSGTKLHLDKELDSYMNAAAMDVE